jgi:Arc/MetJ-type ribon-helix-helix transcriptional regulator
MDMKTLTVRLPEPLAADIEAESRRRGLSKSDIVRERLERARETTELPPSLADIADLIGSVEDDLPADLSARTKHYLRMYGFGRNRSR